MEVANNRELADISSTWSFDPLTNTTDINWLRDTYVLPALVVAHGIDWGTTTTEWQRIVTLRKRATAFTNINGGAPNYAANATSIRELIEYAEGPPAGQWFCTSFNTVYCAMLLCVGIQSRMYSILDNHWAGAAWGDEPMEVWSNDYNKWCFMHANLGCWVHNGNNIPLSMLEIFAASNNSATTLYPQYDTVGNVPPNMYNVTFEVWNDLNWFPYTNWGLEYPPGSGVFIDGDFPGNYPDLNATTGVTGFTKLFSQVGVWVASLWFNSEGGWPSAKKRYAPAGYTFPYFNLAGSVSNESTSAFFNSNINSLHVELVDTAVTLTHNMPSNQFGEYQRRWVNSDNSKTSWATVTATHTLIPPDGVISAEYRAVNKLGY